MIALALTVGLFGLSGYLGWRAFTNLEAIVQGWLDALYERFQAAQAIRLVQPAVRPGYVPIATPPGRPRAPAPDERWRRPQGR